MMTLLSWQQKVKQVLLTHLRMTTIMITPMQSFTTAQATGGGNCHSSKGLWLEVSLRYWIKVLELLGDT